MKDKQYKDKALRMQLLDGKALLQTTCVGSPTPGMTYLHDMQLQSKISIRANDMLHILSLPSLNMESSVRMKEGLYLHAALG